MAKLAHPTISDKALQFLASMPAESARFVLDRMGAPDSVELPAPPKRAPVPMPPRPRRRATKSGSSDAPRSRKERNRARAAKLRQREDRYLQRLNHKVLNWGASRGAPFIRQIPMRVWVACRQMMADPTGRAARLHLKRLNNRAGAVLAAAGLLDDDRTWAQMTTRRKAVFGIAMIMLSRRTARRGPWGGCIMGIPRGAFCALLTDPFDCTDGATPAETTLFGTHRVGGSPDNGSAGYIHALRKAGLVYRQQLPASIAHPCETWGPSGYATSRYWTITDTPHQIDDPELREWVLQYIDAATQDAHQLVAQLARLEPAPPN